MRVTPSLAITLCATHHIRNHKQRTTNRPTTIATTSSTASHDSIHPTTTFNHKHNFHNAPHNNNRQSANKQNFLSITLGNLECLIEHTTNVEESLYLEGEGGRSKSKTLRMDGSSFLDHWS